MADRSGHGNGELLAGFIDIGLGHDGLAGGHGLLIPVALGHLVVGRGRPVIGKQRVAIGKAGVIHIETRLGAHLEKTQGIRLARHAGLGGDFLFLFIQPGFHHAALPLERRVEFVIQPAENFSAHLDEHNQHQHQAKQGHQQGIEGNQLASQGFHVSPSVA